MNILRAVLLACLISVAYGADGALNAKCNELLLSMKKTYQDEPRRTAEENAFATEMTVFYDSLITSTDSELKYHFLRWQSLALINSNSQMLRIYEKKGKGNEDEFYRTIKSQVDEAQKMVAMLEELHQRSR